MEQRKITNNIIIENAKLIYRNFSGKKTEYNKDGLRNFCVLLDDELAEKLKADGWNIKYRKPKADDPDQYAAPYIQVKVQYGMYPPNVVMITSKGKKLIDEETISQLDWTRIQTADVQIRPYNYAARNGKPAGVSAYLKSMYVTIVEDPLDTKYSDIPVIEGQMELPFDV